MEGDEMELIVQLLLESRTSAYIDRLAKKLIWLLIIPSIRTHYQYCFLQKKRNQQAIKLIISFGVGKLFPLVG
jgi:hypothetical protein